MGDGGIPSRGRVVGVDLGSRRIGIAASDNSQVLAMAATTVLRRDDRRAEHLEIAGLVAEYDAVGLVVGLPLSLSGRAGPAAQLVDLEVTELREALGVAVETVDERLTTVTASAALRRSGRRARRQRDVIDQVAAAVLLQSWLDGRMAAKARNGEDRVDRAVARRERPGT